MKAFMTTALLVIGCVSLEPAVAQPAAHDATYDAIMQRTREWANAEMTLDVDKLSQIVDDEWTAEYPGHFRTKAGFLASIKSGKGRLLSCDLGPHEIKAYGDIAVVQGTVDERRDGTDGIIHVAYMDVWAKRGGKWLVVRSMWKKL